MPSQRPSSFRFASFLLLSAFSLLGTAGAQQVQYSSVHRNSERALTQTISGGTAKLRATLAGSRTPLSVVTADFDEDGTDDLVTGYATAQGGALLLQRGNPRALAPTPTEWAITAAGQLVTPYVAKSEVIALPVSPSLLATGDFDGHGHPDLLAAAIGDSTVYFLHGLGNGSFAAPQALPLAGTVSAITLWRNHSEGNLLVAAVCGPQGCGLQFLDRTGLTKAFVTTPAAATAIQIGNIDNGSRADLALIAGGKVLVLEGDTALQANSTIETLPVPSAAALALGTFVPDRHPGLQVAVLGADATLHILTRQGIDASYDPTLRAAQQKAAAARLAAGMPRATQTLREPRRTGLPWVEAETVPNAGPGGPAIMLRARLTGGGNDDLAIMAAGQYITIAHPVVRDATHFSVTPIVSVDSTATPVTAALAARVSADARLGIVALGSGVHPLTVALPATYKTYTVNTNTDATPTAASRALCVNNAAGCTLRSALTQANLDRSSTGTAKVDTINIAAGTYTLSAVNTNSSGQTQNPDYLGSVNYHLEIEASMNLVGAGSGSTIINGNAIDQTITVDYGSFYSTSSGDFESALLDAFISNVTIENGKNPNATTCANSLCNTLGGNMMWLVEGASNLVMNNVVLTSGNATTYGGGGIDVSSDGTGTGQDGPLEIDNSTITLNKTSSSGGICGGGINLEPATSQFAELLVLTGDVITSNTATAAGAGICSNANPGQITISNTTISSNTAQGQGGGLYIESPLTMTGSTIANNIGIGYGGGMYLNGNTYSESVKNSTFTGNYLSAALTGTGFAYTTDGGAVCAQGDSANQAYTFQYDRFHGNGATGSIPHSTGIGTGCDYNQGTATVTATDNWWGCNPTTAVTATAAGGYAIAGTGCDTMANGNGVNTTIGSPYTALTLGLSAVSVTQGSTITATASLGQDSSGTVYTAANDTAYLATPITTFTLTEVGTQTYSPSATAFSTNAAAATSNAAATDTATTNTSGNGTATLTVDGFTITKSYTVVNPADLTVTSAHTGNFKAGDTADAYTLTVANIGNASTSATVTVTDTPPSGFTATALSGSGWTCDVSHVTCTRSDALASSVTYPAITLTVSVSSTDVGTYTNTATVSGGGEVNTSNDTYNDSTIVVGQPTIAEAFSPTTVAPNVNSTVTFTLGNPSANAVSLTGVGFSDTLPAGLKVATPNGATTACNSSTVTAAAGGTSIALSGATLVNGSSCTVTVNVVAAAIGSYTNATGNVTATNSNAGGTASATLAVAVTPTRLVFTSSPATPITAGGNAGTFTVALEDAAGNIATNISTGNIVVQVTASGYLQNYSGNITNGVATFGLGSIPLTSAQTYTCTATDSGYTSATATEVVTPGPAASFVVSGLGAFTAPQMSGTATAKAVDQYGNTATGFTGTATLTSTDPSATFSPASYTYTASDAGVHTFTVTFNTAGTFSVTATGASFTGAQTGIVVADAIWILNTNDLAVRLTDAGVQTNTSGSTSGSSQIGALAFDATGAVWATQQDNDGLVKFTAAGTPVTVNGNNGSAGISAPSSLFIDGLGQVWVANTGNSSISVLSNATSPVSPTTGYQPGKLSIPTGILVDSSGSVWVTNLGTSQITKLFGAAAPAVTPTVNGTIHATLGSQP